MAARAASTTTLPDSTTPVALENLEEARMKIKIIVVDLELSRRAKRHALLLGVPVVLLLAASGVALSAVPFTFSPGDQLTAQSMNANFADLDGRISASGRFVASVDGGAKYSMGATAVCGTTAAVNGKFSGANGKVGYAAAKAQCESVSTCSPSAHMCTAQEVMTLAQMGIVTPSGWISVGDAASTPGPGQVTNDCGGWTSDNSGNVPNFGVLWGGAFSGWDGCNASHPILCCD
jgi:hypothetical protein